MNKIEFGDNRETMKKWAEEGVKVQMCVTSPPYYGLRDYGTGEWTGGDPTCDHIEHVNSHGGERADRDQSSQVFQFTKVCSKCGALREDKQLGQEDTPEEFIENMVDVFRHVREILADDGVIWVNMGDSYYNYRPGSGAYAKQTIANSRQDLPMSSAKRSKKMEGLKNKDLIGIPWMLAFALRADGWFLRQDIIWHKPNPMPESVRDRCTKTHEYIFLLSKNQHYYFNHEAIKEPSVYYGKDKRSDQGNIRYEGKRSQDTTGKNGQDSFVTINEKRNKRSVWTVNTKPYKGAHFATYPMELIEPCILAGSKPGDIVLDPFMGSGTTAQTALKHGRQYLGCELNESYHDLQQERIAKEQIGANPDLFEIEVTDTTPIINFDDDLESEA